MKLLKQARINNICLFQEYHTPLTVPKKGRPRALPDPVRINAAHYPDNIPATASDPSPNRECTVCGRKK